MADIFISYASKDQSSAETLANALEKQGWSVWWDRTIPVGKTWDEVIEEAIDAAKCIVVIWSNKAVASGWVRSEAEEGLRRNVLVPVLIEDAKIPLRFRSIQAAPLYKWQGDVSHSGFKRLMQALIDILGNPKQTARPRVRQPEIVGTFENQRTSDKLPPNVLPFSEAQSEALKIFAKGGLTNIVNPLSTDKSDSSSRELVDKELEPAKSAKKSGLFSDETVKRILALKPKETFKNSIGMEFVLIPPGRFKMGSGISPEEVVRRYGGKEVWPFEYEHPMHNVTISQPFYLQSTVVTKGQWQRMMGNNPSNFTDCGDSCPVENVSWDDAQDFIKKLNEKEKADKHRLPTEAEWEYACRAGTTTEFSFGDDAIRLGAYAWYYENSNKQTHPVGQKEPNGWGLYDMHGNVYEWVEDDMHGNYNEAPSDERAWIDEPRGTGRVVRGGSWSDFALKCRSAMRHYTAPDYGSYYYGFRLARSVTLGP